LILALKSEGKRRYKEIEGGKNSMEFDVVVYGNSGSALCKDKRNNILGKMKLPFAPFIGMWLETSFCGTKIEFVMWSDIY
jgi:hypothetical protein